MKLKTVTVDGKTFAEIQDGKPVYVQDDGKEVAFDAPHTVNTISRLQGEAKGHREAKEAAEAALKVFDGLDAGAARDALDKLSKLDAKKLVEAGDMDAAIAAAIKPYTEKLNASEKLTADLTSQLNREVIGNRFSQSKFAAEKLTPAGVDLIKTLYGERIKVENGAVYGTDQNGQKVYSRARPGELADFDELVETFVETYPHKDHILKGNVKPGGGAGGGGGGDFSKTIKTSDFNALPPKERAAKMAAGVQLID